MKIRSVTPGVPFNLVFFCPGCQGGHGFNTEPNKDNGRGGSVPVWTYNGDNEKPTISPSILIKGYGGKDNPHGVCHTMIKDGNIQFLPDCTHALAGKTVPMEDF